MDSNKYLLSRKNQVGLLLAILVVVLHIVLGFGALWPVAAVAAYGAGAALTPPAKPRQEALPAPIIPTTQQLDDVMRHTSRTLASARAPKVVMDEVRVLEDNARFVFSQWDHLEPTPQHRQTMWNVLKVYYPETAATYLKAPQYREGEAAQVMAETIRTLSDAIDRIKKGILEDNLRALDSQAQYLRNELGALPGLDDGFEEAEGYDQRS